MAGERRRYRVTGIVQGVGFRPFVFTLATRLGLTGFVGNDSSGVFVEVQGPAATLDSFAALLQSETPPLAHIEQITFRALPLQATHDFVIAHSEADPNQRTLISPDQAICADCLRELFDPADRRYRYPFINCTNCGPRFTITRDIPYDRPLTTMAGFTMCAACQAEYDDPHNRRFHAQPNACPVCGPQVSLALLSTEIKLSNLTPWPPLRNGAGEADPPSPQRRGVGGEVDWRTPNPALPATQQLLTAGQIVAVKGIGGFHLACDATNDAALAQLRMRKGRIDKPFAVMALDLEQARRFAEINRAEAALLTSPARPIVLLRKRADYALSPLVAPGNPYIGVMLPYTPLHYLLLTNPALATPFTPLVMTSGNLSDEPIVTDNEEALAKLADLADAFLLHDRPIHVPCDDSVLRVFHGHELPIRRSRGYAPFPVRLPFRVETPVLAVGGELKSTFCLAYDQHAFLSQHIGDMENLETLDAFSRAVDHFTRIFRIEPQIIACDRHPGYLSSRWAENYCAAHHPMPPVVKVQHHHAHLAALLAEHGLTGDTPIIGCCFDGTGYGDDGAIWGGEVLLADYQQAQRVAHLAYVPLPGGDASVKRPYRIALAHLWAAGVAWDARLPPVVACSLVERGVLLRQLASGFQTVPTSSMGRLFDAVAALAGIRQVVTYEAQAAIELEALVADAGTTPYAFTLSSTLPWQIDPAPVIRAIAADVLNGVPLPLIATRFHLAVAELIVTLATQLRATHGLSTVGLSGGVFQNVQLLQLTFDRLQAAGFTTLVHQHVPPNDGGLALGQAIIAASGVALSPG